MNMAKKKKKSMARVYLAMAVTFGLLIAIVILLITGISSCVSSCAGNNGSENPEASDNIDSNTSDKGNPPISENELKQSEEPVSTGGSSDEEADWALYVIGNNDPLPDDFTVKTKVVAGERELDERCADYAIKMLEDAKADGIDLFVTSSYRSIQKQAENLESYKNTLIAQGMSPEEAEKQAKLEIALPGCSEHNAGLAMDIVSSDYWSNHDDLDESFEELPHFDWLIANSWKYGFILSYPEGKEDITGFIYEPWHYRFVGLKHAKKIHEVYEETGEFLTVNEYIEEYIEG